MRSRITRTLLATAMALCAAVAAAIVVAPGTASATSTDHLWACWRNPNSNDARNGGCAEVWAKGEIVKVRDFQADGWGTRAQIQKKINGVWVNHSHNCFDDTNRSNTTEGGWRCNYNVGEGRKIRLHVWASRNGTFKWHIYSPVGTA